MATAAGLAGVIERYLAQADKPPMLERLAAWWHWLLAEQAVIRDVSGVSRPLIPNATQARLAVLMFQQTSAGKPIRVICLKARKRGVSTLVQSLFVFLGAHYGQQVAYTLAHQADATDELWRIGKRMSERYRLVGPEVTRHLIAFPDTGSALKFHTAGGDSVAAASTVNLLHLSERALWSGLSADETEYASLGAVPFVATSVVVIESSPRGRDRFFKRFEDACIESDDAYVPLFVPWVADPDDVRTEESIDGDPTDEERAVLELAKSEYGVELDGRHLQWRRHRIRELGPNVFRQEFPLTVEESVQGSADLVIPALSSCVEDSLPFDPACVGSDIVLGGVDIGYSDNSAVVTCVHRAGVLWVVECWTGRQCLAADVAAVLWENVCYYVDPSELSMRHEIAEAARRQGREVWLNPAPRRKAERQATFTEFEWQLIRQRIADGTLKLWRPAAAQLIRESLSFQYNPRTGQPHASRSEDCGHFDALHALKYAVMGLGLTDVVLVPGGGGRDASRSEELGRSVDPLTRRWDAMRDAVLNPGRLRFDKAAFLKL